MQLNSPWKVIQGFEVGYENYFGAYELAAFFKYGGVRIGFDTLDDEKRRVEYLEFSLNFNL
jgi:alpha-L-arabinofuranosidase